MKNDKWLITVDLDGTLLNSGKPGMSNYEYNPLNTKIIKKLMEMGHEVAIVTGRPWRNSERIYNELGLNTIIANYNGAHIHHPYDEGFIPLIFSMNRHILMNILEEDLVVKAANAYIIETIDHTYVKGNSSKLILGVINSEEWINSIKWNLGDELPVNPQAAFVGIKHEEYDPYELLHTLRRKYGNSMFFRLWDGRDLNDPFVVLEINQIGSNKGTAMMYICSYYNIKPSNTIAFGDGLNDREMLQQASVGVAMKNSKGTVKTFANDSTDYTNDEGGVGRYLKEFFKV